MNQKAFAALVINYNGEKYLRACIDSLYKSDVDNLTDIYIVDNHSSDGSLKYCAKTFPKVKFIQTASNLGFAGAYNFAHEYLKKKRLSYTYYFIVNNDTSNFSPGLFSRMKSLFEKDSSIGIITPTVIDSKSKIQSQGGKYYFISGTTFGYRRGEQYQPKDSLVSSKWATGCALFVPSNLFGDVGGFDDYFMYQEDVGLSWKVLNKGYKVVCDCLTSVLHYGGGTYKSSIFENYYAERNRIIMYYQNLSAPVFLLILPIFLIIRILLLPLQRSFPVAWVKLKALFVGLATLSRYPRRNRSISRDKKTVGYFFSQIKEYENPLSNP